MRKISLVLLTITLLLVVSQATIIEEIKEKAKEEIQHIGSNVEQVAVDVISKELGKDPKKMLKCIKTGIAEIKDLIQLVKDIKQKKIPGSAQDIINLLKRVGALLDNCGSLFCWQPTLNKCRKDGNPQGCEKYGLLVYPQCKKGFSTFGCCTCTNNCPEGFTDNGLYCLKPEAYGRGAGYVLWKEEQCKKENPQGCEKSGLLWYPKCQPGFHPVGCCICSPDCPADWTDIGISCKKPDTYSRGVGYPVSFGLKCLFARKVTEEQGSCEEQRGFLGIIVDSVEHRLEEMLKSEEYQFPFSNEISDLMSRLNIFGGQCIEPKK